jgi:hypothetical protein
MSDDSIDPAVTARISQRLKEEQPGSCFIECHLASFTDGVVRCMVTMPERQIRFMARLGKVLDDKGEAISVGQLVVAWKKGWVLGQVAGVGNEPPHFTLVRVYQPDEDPLEIEVEERCLVRKSS